MATLYTQQSKNIRKTWLLMSLFLIVVVGIGWVFSQIYGDSSFVVIAVVFSLFMNFFSYWFSDKIVLAMSGAHPIKREENPELHRIVENLCITAGLKMPKLYIINDESPNAFAAGRNQEHAAVAVTSGLLQIFKQERVRGGHRPRTFSYRQQGYSYFHHRRNSRRIRGASLGFFLRAQFSRGRRDNREGGGQAQLIMMIVGIILAILAPIIAMLIQLAISEKENFSPTLPERFLTRYPEGLASAPEKFPIILFH